MDVPNAQCDYMASPNILNFILSILIMLGILVSYFPQLVRIAMLRSSFGISPYFVLLGTTSGTFALANMVSQRQSLQDVACCKDVSGLACFAGLLGILQVATQLLSFFAILTLFVAFFPRESSTSPPLSPNEAKGPTYRTALVVAGICIVHAVIMLIVTLAVGFKQPSSLQSWSNFCGVTAAILASIQYFPQIYTTLRLQCVGSFSIPMMCIQTPGAFVWAGSLAARLGSKGWSTWGILIVTACLQGVLLVLAVFFEYLGPNKGHSHDYNKDTAPSQSDESNDAQDDDGPYEETPLLQDSR
ncbi:PQ-loop repeat-containing protein [Aspergillus stella-maris]|uniref:PQ-loop repeat-containing protein n=1 Tax=Aspergillus stella-maris TaxID=1810926 RepID=UPI003CCCAEC3